jgi:hypothetical protein
MPINFWILMKWRDSSQHGADTNVVKNNEVYRWLYVF